MTFDAGQLTELQILCPGASVLVEAGIEYVHLPALSLPPGAAPSQSEALLCPQQHGGYVTRLFLASPVAGRGANWTAHTIFGRNWHSWSWNGVSPSLRLAQILSEHLRGLR